MIKPIKTQRTEIEAISAKRRRKTETKRGTENQEMTTREREKERKRERETETETRDDRGSRESSKEVWSGSNDHQLVNDDGSLKRKRQSMR